MKKVLLFLLFAICSLSALQASHFGTNSSQQTFKITVNSVQLEVRTIAKDEVAIVRCPQASNNVISELVIPDGFKASDGNVYYITKIASNAKICGGFISVSIPKTVKEIGDNAFMICDRLASVKILGDVNMSSRAFLQCKQLRTVTVYGKCNIKKGSTIPVDSGRSQAVVK